MNPWSDIGKPETTSGYNSILCNPEHPYYFYWGIDYSDRYVFRFMGEFTIDTLDKLPEMSGIEVLLGVEGDRSHVTLILENKEDSQIFYHLSKSLMDATEVIPVDQDAAAAKVIFTHLKRWQIFLKNRGKKSLSLNEQIGLFGELLVLDDIFLANLPPDEAIACWTGPLGHEQDFSYGQSLVEVKTSRSSNDSEVTIASENQLDTVSGNITLLHQTLAVFEDNPPESISLNHLVAQLSEKISDQSLVALDSFNMVLLMIGYEPKPEYDKYHFSPILRNFYAVDDGFPRIESSKLPLGLNKVRYNISLEHIISYMLNKPEASNRILKGIEEPSCRPVRITLSALLNSDECSYLEFKSSLRYCYSTNEYNKNLEFAVIKTISAFANTSGGVLVIGIDDNKKILGLSKDYTTLKNVQQNIDGFNQHITTLLINNFGEAFVSKHISLIVKKHDDNEVCIVQVDRSADLLFLEVSNKAGQKTKKLYARFENSSREIPPEQIPKYIKSRN